MMKVTIGIACVVLVIYSGVQTNVTRTQKKKDETTTKHNSKKWLQVGDDLFSIFTSDYDLMAGASVDISDDGKIVAIGEPFTYMYYEPYPTVKVRKHNEDLEKWIPFGSDISFHDEHTIGHDVCLSRNGKRIAMIFSEYEMWYAKESVRVFDYDSSANDWIEVGTKWQAFSFDPYRDDAQQSIEMSKDGMRLAVVGRDEDNDKKVRVFEYLDNERSWKHIGNDIALESPMGMLSDYMKMNHDGSHIVVAESSYYGSWHTKSKVLVYEYNSTSTTWEHLGEAIENVQANPEDTHSSATISISGSGDRIAIGFPINATGDGSYYYDSSILVYEFGEMSRDWIQLGGQIDRVTSIIGLGFTAKLSSDSSHIAMGGQVSKSSNGYYFPIKSWH